MREGSHGLLAEEHDEQNLYQVVQRDTDGRDAVAEQAPGPDDAVAPQRQGLKGARHDGDHIARPNHLYRRGAAHVGAVAELAIAVVTPGPDRTVAPERHGVKA